MEKISGEKENKLFCAGVLAVKALGILLLVFLLGLYLTNRADISMDKKEVAEFTSQPVQFYVWLLLSLLAIFSGWTKLEQISEASLIRFFTIAYLIVGFYLILNVEPQLRADAKHVYNAAVAFGKRDYGELELGGYLFRYPHQLGLLTYDRLLGLFSDNIQFLFIMNLLLVLLSNYHLYRIADLWFGGDAMVNRYTILFAYLFLPHLFLILFAYGAIPGMSCLLLAVYRATRFLQEKDKTNGVLTVLFASLAVLLRNNYMIAVIAMIAVLALECLRKPGRRNLLVTAVLVAALFLPQNLLNTWYAGKTGLEIPGGEPKLLWVAMGMQEGSRGAGWYNSYNTVTFRESGYDEEAAAAAAEEAIRQRMEEFKADRKYASEFYREKIITTWCEPTFQSLWSGPLEDCGQEIYTDTLKDLYSGGASYEAVSLVCSVLAADILLLTLAYLFLEGKNSGVLPLFAVVNLMGGFLFHLLWETKSQYVWGYVFCLIPLAARAVKLLWEKWNTPASKRK